MKDTKEKVPKARDNLSEMVRPGCGVNKPSYIRQWHNRPQIMLFILCYPRYRVFKRKVRKIFANIPKNI